MLQLFERHRERLERAVEATATRGWWSAFPEAPSGRIYGETAAADGKAAFEARLNRPFELDQPSTGERIGEERSPYGFPLGITYPAPDLDRMLATAEAALRPWRDAGAWARVGLLLEVLDRLSRRSFELAHSVMHTTGQGFVMAFQAGGPHAQDRGLEALAYAHASMARVPEAALWEKPAGKDRADRYEKHYAIAPRGIGLVVGCSTFPTWNSYPAIFANLACGNPVLVKPHPRAVLPLALTVAELREALAEFGMPSDLVQLVVDTDAAPVTKDLALRPEIRLVDYTGCGSFGDWLEANARQALVFTEKAGVNPVVLHSTSSYQGMLRNLTFSLALYSGQMCTAPQNMFVPADGIATDEGHKSFGDVSSDLVAAIDRLLADPERGAELLGCIAGPPTLERLERVQAEAGVRVLRRSEPLAHPAWPDATVRTPLLIGAVADDRALYNDELFGPIAFLVATRSVEEAIGEAKSGAIERGAITAAIHSTDRETLARMERAMLDAGVALSENLTGGVFVNQSAAFSDFHVSGANPAGNATLTDEAFVASRYRVVQRRAPVVG